MTQGEGPRADVDGLRALAVLGVMLFHVSFGALRGGLVGFDVLFVTSGFLVTRSIRGELLRTRSFRFADFYLRRARRLLPALFFTLAATFGVAYLLFSPADLQHLGGAEVHAVTGLSNILFWSQGSYAEALSRADPLLPTWAVSVLVQLYLVWPALLVVLLRRTPRSTVPLSVAAVAVLGFGLNLAFADGELALPAAMAPHLASWLSDGPATLFYLTPFRIFEFASGAALVWAVGWRPKSRLVSESLAVAGLVGIATATRFDPGSPSSDSAWALLACLGTALFLWAGTAFFASWSPGRWLAKLGSMSFALYLVHWPVAVFLHYATHFEPNVAVGAIIFGLSVGLAALVHRWVEKPLQAGAGPAARLSPGAFGVASALFALGICFLGAGAWANRGWPWRFGSSDAVQALGDIDALSLQRRQYLNRNAASYFLHPKQTRNLIALSETLDGRFEVQPERYLARCRPAFLGHARDVDDECSEILASLDFSLKVHNADEVYLAFETPRLVPDEFAPLIEFLRKRARPGVRIVLFGPGPRFPKMQAAAARMLGDGASTKEVERTARRLPEASPEIDRRLKAVADQLGIEFVSRYDILCDDDRCRFFTKNDSLMFLDPVHFTLRGAKWYGSRVAASLFGDAARQPEPAPVIQRPEAILRAYEGLLSAVDGSTVLDVDRLPDSKDVVRRVLLQALRRSSDPAEQEKLKTGVKALAFFQPGVGEKGASLDAEAPGGGTWREAVEADIKGIVEGMSAEGFGP